MDFTVQVRRWGCVVALATLGLWLMGGPRVSHLQEMRDVPPLTPGQTFMVTNTDDAGQGSFRQAVLDANANTGLDAINFNIPGSGMRFFPLSVPMPTVTSPVIIDGTTQPGYAGVPLITLTGISNGQALNITAGNSTVKGLAMYDFIGAGTSMITLSGGGNNVITGNYFGINANNTRGSNTSSTGILIDGSDNNRIGGTTPAERNYFVINSGINIVLRNDAASNQILGNWFGTGPNGARFTMQRESIRIENSPNNLIGIPEGTTPGGACTGGCNAIGATGFQGGAGISITGAASTGNRIRSNWIGLLPNGSSVNRIDGFGINIDNARNNFIGGNTAQERNVITGSSDSGIRITGIGSTGNVITGNYIGTFSNGTSWPLANEWAIRGVLTFNGSSNTRVGGLSVGERNVISGNRTNVLIQGSTSNILQGNYIGTDFTGMFRSPTTDIGIYLVDSANNTIGGTQGTTPGGPCTPVCNLISGNGNNGQGDGILAVRSDNNIIDGNYIGFNALGTGTILNGRTPDGSVFNGYAIRLVDSSNNTIGRRKSDLGFEGGDADDSAQPRVLRCIQGLTGHLCFQETGAGPTQNGPDGTVQPASYTAKSYITGQQITDIGTMTTTSDLITLLPGMAPSGFTVAGVSSTNQGFARFTIDGIDLDNGNYLYDTNVSLSEVQEFQVNQHVAGTVGVEDEVGADDGNNHIGIFSINKDVLSRGITQNFPTSPLHLRNTMNNTINGTQIASINQSPISFLQGTQNNRYSTVNLSHPTSVPPVFITPGANGATPVAIVETGTLPPDYVRVTAMGVPGTQYRVHAFGKRVRPTGLFSAETEIVALPPDTVPNITINTDGIGQQTVQLNYNLQAISLYGSAVDITVVLTPVTDTQDATGVVLGGSSAMSAPATLPGVTVSGRVTAPDGRGLRNAVVTMTDTYTNATRTATTSAFGFYTFSDVPRVARYTIAVSSKRYRISSRVEDVILDALGNVDFVAQE